MIATYSITLLGGCSPVHCRMVVALFGLFGIILSYVSGFGICFLYG